MQNRGHPLIFSPTPQIPQTRPFTGASEVDKAQIIAQLDTNLRAALSRNADLERQIKDLQHRPAETTQLINENAKLSDALKVRQKEIEVLNGRMAVLYSDNQALAARIQGIQSERDAALKQVETMRNEANVLKTDNERLSRAYVDQKPELLRELEALKVRNVALREENEQLRSRATKTPVYANSRVLQPVQPIVTPMLVTHSPPRHVQNLAVPADRARINDLEHQVQELQEVNHRLRNTEANIVDNGNQLINENQRINSMLNARLKEVEGLTSRIEVIESEKQALFYKVQTLQMEREKYNQRIEQLQLEKETTIKQVEDRDEVRHLKRTLEDMKFELEGARKKQNAALDEYEELRVKLKTAENSREIAELNGQRMQKRIYEMELELEGANFSEVNSLRRRIFEVEEALRIADNLNQEMAEKMDQFAKESLDYQFHHDVQLNYKRELDEARMQLEQLRKKSGDSERLQDRIFLITSENDRLHAVIDQVQAEVSRGRKQIATFEQLLSQQREDVKMQMEKELDHRVSHQSKEHSLYIERLMAQTQQLESALYRSEEEREALVKRLHNLHQDSSYTIEENYQKALGTIQKYEEQIKSLLAERWTESHYRTPKHSNRYEHTQQSDTYDLERRIYALQQENERLNALVVHQSRDQVRGHARW